MRQASTVVGWLWAAFVLCWLVLAQFNRKATRTGSWRPAWALRLAVLIGVLVMILPRRHGVASHFVSITHALPFHVAVTGQWTGVGLCVVGFAFAVWARVHLGRNWGMPMSLRQGHELVTSGPYAYARHPIYTGIMLAMIGSALAVGVLWLLLFALYFAYFIVSRRTKMLIPFVF